MTRVQPPPAETPRSGTSLDNRWLGLVIFLASYALVFAFLTTIHLYFRGLAAEPLPLRRGWLDLLIPVANVAMLVGAALTTTWALRSIREGRWAGVRLGLTATVLLGTIFSVLQSYELGTLDFGISTGTHAASFLTLSIFHGLHVVVGVFWAGIALARATRGYVDPAAPFALQSTALYWYFITVFWVVMFAVLYL